jgi:magnesium transporter
MEQAEFLQVQTHIRQALNAGRFSEAVHQLSELHPADRADLFFRLDPDLQVALIEHFDILVTAEILEELSDEAARDTAEGLSTERLADVLDQMDPDDAADVLGDLSPAKAALALAEMEEADEVIPLLSHPDETAGGLMTTDYIILRRRTTAGEAIEFLRQVGPEAETPYYLYVVDREGRLIGIVGLRDLIVAAPQTPVEQFMDPDVVVIRTGADQEEAARTMAHYDLAVLPVVDEGGLLQGVITYDDVIDVLEDEATEDVLNLAAIEAGAISSRPYWSLRIPEVVRSRFVWLLVLFVGQTLTTSVLRRYQSEMQSAISLSFFVPLLIGTGGNAGSQTVTTVIRAIALDEVRTRDVLRVLWREVRAGALLGLLLSLVAYSWVLLSGLTSELALIVAGTVFFITIWANLVGAAIPLLASRIGVDPTVMSAPLISTLVDATGLLIYFTIAILILEQM